MDTEHDYQSYSTKRNGKPTNQPMPQMYAAGADSGDGVTLDMAWLFAVARRRFFVMAGVAIALGAISGGLIVWNSKKIIPVYEGYFRVLVEPVTAEGRLAKLSLLAQTGSSTGVTDVSKLSVADSDLVDYETQIRVLKSPKLMEPLIGQLKSVYPDINSYNSLLTRLAISRVTYEKDGKQGGTKILEVRYQDKDTKKIKFVLGRLRDAYLTYSLQERLTSLNRGIKFIDEQLPELQQRVDTLQRQLQKLREEYSLSDPESTGRFLTDTAQSLETQRIGVQSELAQARTQYINLQKQLKEGSSLSVISKDSKAYETIVGQLQKIETDIATESAQFREDSPPMQALREKRENLRNLLARQAQGILENVGGQVKELEARSKVIDEKQQINNRQRSAFPTVLRRYSDLQQDLQIATDSLKVFLAKRVALKLDAAQRETPWEEIAPPAIVLDEFGQPMPASVKQTSRQLAIALILSILVGIGSGFLAEVLHTVFHTPEEVKGATKLPLLGVIPYAKQLKKLSRRTKKLPAVVEKGSLTDKGGIVLPAKGNKRGSDWASPFFEAFRSLYTNIRLLSAGTPIHSLAISSAVPGDGKSTTATYLAQTAAAIGQRVLLVDADLRRPTQHTRLGLPNVQGLTEVITTDLSLNDAIQRSPDDDNLFVLTAGQTPLDPIKLLSSEKMQYLMEQFQAFFDLVIYDTPPLIGISDTNLIAAQTDGIILVVGLEKTDRDMLKKSLDGLRISGASVLGVVANGIKGYAPNTYATYQRYYRTNRQLAENPHV
jgi:capsular exopolysaccharide synthesis family protein